mmetsp:Transcript_72332/g.199459  ORF Transcript_72332/g.199459 Transcript_72332/m.199459 type:complete len:143 (-) Transcript_72332:242-670(-)
MRGWEIRGDCAACGQHRVLGFMLEDDETQQLVFWCCACIDERSDWVVPAPTPGEESDYDEVVGTLKRPHEGETDEEGGTAAAKRPAPSACAASGLDAHPAIAGAEAALGPAPKRPRSRGGAALEPDVGGCSADCGVAASGGA